MLRFTLSLCLAWASQSLRRHSESASITAFSNTFTTLDGCKCKDECFAKVGTKWVCDTCKTEGGCGTWSPTGRWGYCDYSTSTVRSFVDRSYNSKISYYWKNIIADRTRYPNYPLLGNILSSVRTSFDNYRPEMPPRREKMIHSVGSVCKINVDIGPQSKFTGLLAPGNHKGFIRMGGAVDPSGGITPGLGFKFPRSGVHDGDFVSLYSLVQGTQWDFFGKNQSTHITPAEGVTKVLAKKFEDASNCPYQVGLSDFAQYSEEGRESNPPKFPFKLFFVANSNLKTGQGELSIDGVHSELDAIPIGTKLYSMFSCAISRGDELSPTENLLESCGRPMFLGNVVTTSECTTSYYGDKSFQFRHQRIEEDWLVEPGYMSMPGYSANVACGKRVDARGAPPRCGEGDMLNSDA